MERVDSAQPRRPVDDVRHPDDLDERVVGEARSERQVPDGDEGLEELRRPRMRQRRVGAEDQDACAGLDAVQLGNGRFDVGQDLADDEKVVLAFRGKCPKQADEVDKTIAALRKRFSP